MRTPLAWHKVTHNKLRTAASLSGVCLALVLVFMQLGFYDACYRSSTMVLDQFDFDIGLVSPQYLCLRVPGAIPRRRLMQARGVPSVASASPVYIGNGEWHNPTTRIHREVLVLGVDPSEPSFRLPELAVNVLRLAQDDTGIWDTKAQRGYDAVGPGTSAGLQDRQVKIVATYDHGAGFISPATILVSDRTLARCFPGYPLQDVSIGLVKVQPGTDVAASVQALRATLPSDTLVLPRPQLEAYDQAYFMKLKPLGIMFGGGVILALIVGAVILYQILASEVMNHFKEYATLRAIGYSKRFVNRLVLMQATWYAVLGFVPATLLSFGLYAVTRMMTNLPMFLTWPRSLLVLVLAVLMCAFSGLFVTRKVHRADPVELF